MAKDYNVITKEVCTSKNAKCTLSFTPELKLSTENEFNQIISKDSYVKIRLNDFSNGKGDSATVVDYNITWDVFLVVAAGLLNFTLPAFEEFKCLKKHPETEGMFKGMFKCRTIKLEFLQGQRYPWKIMISNGYSPSNDGRNMTGIKKAQMFMTTTECCRIFNDVAMNIKLFYNTMGMEHIKKGYEKMAEVQKGYRKNANELAKPQNAANRYTIKVVSDTVQYGNVYGTYIDINGIQYMMYHQDRAPELESARYDNRFVDVFIQNYNNNIYYCGLAA